MRGSILLTRKEARRLLQLLRSKKRRYGGGRRRNIRIKYGGEGTLNERHTSLHISLLLVMHLPIELRQIVSSYAFFASLWTIQLLK